MYYKVSNGGTDFSDYTVTSYNRDGNKSQTIVCDIGDVIIVGAYGTIHQYQWNPSFTTGATTIQQQTYNDGGSTRVSGVIGVAIGTSVTISWYQAGSDGIIRVIHTPLLNKSTYTIEKSYATAMSSKTVTDLKVGDIIVGNTGNTGSAYNSINNIINGADLAGNDYIGQAYVVIKDTATVRFGGSSTQYTMVAFRH